MYGEQYVPWLIGIGAALAAGLARAVWGAVASPRAKARRRRLRAPATLEEGAPARLIGTVVPLGELLEAPLTGRLGVGYVAAASVRPQGEQIVEARLVPFALATEDALVVIEATRADLAIPTRALIPRRLELEHRFLRDRGITGAVLAQSAFEEAVIEPGARISVYGVVRIDLDAASSSERSYRDDGPRRYVLVDHPAHPMTIDLPR